MSDLESREVRSPTAVRRAVTRLTLILLITFAILATLIWNGLLIFWAGQLLHLW
jgi:hypothetical protein